MVSNFEKNDKFMSCEGILYRRDFFVNILIIKIIESLIWVTPCMYFLFTNPKLILDFNLNSPNPTYPFWFVVWECLAGIVVSVLYFPSIVRRMRDITAFEDNQKLNFISAVLSVLIFMVYTPAGSNYLAKWIFLIINIVLLATNGKISAQKPKDEVIKFNWGAFFGTWIWGIFNKIKKTFLIIPLFFTFAWFPFMLICGLKGNQWVYENAENIDIEGLHKAQHEQAKLWTILFPFLFFLTSIFTGISIGQTLKYFVKTTPKPKIIKLLNDYSEVAVKSTFESIKYENGTYNFYISPINWKANSQKSRVNCFKLANDYTKMIYKNEDAEKVFIYSSFNKELLAKYKKNDGIYINSNPATP